MALSPPDSRCRSPSTSRTIRRRRPARRDPHHHAARPQPRPPHLPPGRHPDRRHRHHIPSNMALFQGDFDFTQTKGSSSASVPASICKPASATWLLEAIDPLTGEVITNPNWACCRPTTPKATVPGSSPTPSSRWRPRHGSDDHRHGDGSLQYRGAAGHRAAGLYPRQRRARRRN